jgi:hypothetical protein
MTDGSTGWRCLTWRFSPASLDDELFSDAYVSIDILTAEPTRHFAKENAQIHSFHYTACWSNVEHTQPLKLVDDCAYEVDCKVKFIQYFTLRQAPDWS